MNRKQKQIEQISPNIQVLQYGLFSCLNVNKISRSTVQFLVEEFSIEPRDLFLNRPSLQRPMIRQADDYLSLILRFPVQADLEIKGVDVQLFIFPKTVIILHSNALPSLKLFEQQVRDLIQEKKSAQAFSPKQLVPQLLNLLYEDIELLIHKISNDIDALEDQIFGASLAEKGIVKQLFMIERKVVDIRKIIRSHNMIVPKLVTILPSISDGSINKTELEKLRENPDSVWGNLEANVEAVDTLRSAYESLTSFYLNDILKVLTIASMIIAPMTLIASIWGMNFNNIPLFFHDFGFGLVIIFMVGISAIAFAYFKHKKWL